MKPLIYKDGSQYCVELPYMEPKPFASLAAALEWANKHAPRPKLALSESALIVNGDLDNDGQ